jgi:uncharacterized protein (DUF1778 family)
MVTRSSVRGGGRRERDEVPRQHTLKVRLSGREKETLEAAAGRSGLALGAFVVQAGLDAAEHRAAPVGALQREAVGELIRAAGLVRRIGVNLNQAVTRLNATGEAGPDLAPAAAYCMRVVQRVDEAAQLVCRGLR